MDTRAKTVWLLWIQTSDQYGTEKLIGVFDTVQFLVEWALHNPTPGRTRIEETELKGFVRVL